MTRSTTVPRRDAERLDPGFTRDRGLLVMEMAPFEYKIKEALTVLINSHIIESTLSQLQYRHSLSALKRESGLIRLIN
jgi:hypothetical protein